MKLTNHIARFVPCDQYLYSNASYLHNMFPAPGKYAHISRAQGTWYVNSDVTKCSVIETKHIMLPATSQNLDLLRAFVKVIAVALALYCTEQKL